MCEKYLEAYEQGIWEKKKAIRGERGLSLTA
jgi:hypothetical protein